MNTKKGYGKYDKTVSIKLSNELISMIQKDARQRGVTFSEAIRLMIIAGLGNTHTLDLDKATRIEQTMEGVQEAIFELENHMDVLKRQMKSITKSL